MHNDSINNKTCPDIWQSKSTFAKAISLQLINTFYLFYLFVFGYVGLDQSCHLIIFVAIT